MLQVHASVKKLLNMHDRALDFNLTEFEKLIDMVSDSTLYLTFKKPAICGVLICIIENSKLSEYYF